MNIAVLADEVLKNELLTKGVPPEVTVTWADSMRSLTVIDADVYMDLLFEPDPERTAHLKQLLPKPVLINAVAFSTAITGGLFIRINAWPGMLQRSITEVAIPSAMPEATVKDLFGQLQWDYRLAPDVPGMITPRVLAMIINEAYYTLEAEVSSREEIDIAMKLGTNYPMGPFEWSKKIGLWRVYELLKELSRTNTRYQPAPLLEQEALNS